MGRAYSLKLGVCTYGRGGCGKKGVIPGCLHGWVWILDIWRNLTGTTCTDRKEGKSEIGVGSGIGTNKKRRSFFKQPPPVVWSKKCVCSVCIFVYISTMLTPLEVTEQQQRTTPLSVGHLPPAPAPPLLPRVCAARKASRWSFSLTGTLRVSYAH